MRLAGQMRGGYFPAPPQAVALAAAHLQPPRDDPFSLLDPCAGQGDAIRQLGDLLACPPSRIHAIELDDTRAGLLRTSLPEARVLAPASFFGCLATFNSFSMTWLNPLCGPPHNGFSVAHSVMWHLLLAGRVFLRFT